MSLVSIKNECSFACTLHFLKVLMMFARKNRRKNKKKDEIIV